MEPLVSIIVPVYNAEKYLVRCIESVLRQEYANFELLLVNDGSQDDSGAICDGFAERDSRIRVIHKENTGVSDSRNCALAEAAGKYIQFLDSDDWLTPEATKLFVRSAESSGCDMVIADFYRVSGEKLSHKGDIEREGLLTRQEFAALMMENPADFYYGVLWNKLFRRELIERLNLRMDPEISWCEDFIFNLEYIRHCKSIYALNVPVYYYVKTKGSLVNSQGASINNTIRMKLNVFEYYEQFYREVYDEESYENIRFQVYRFFVTGAKDGFVPPSILPGSVRLGQERQSYALPEALEGDSPALTFYRYRKLLERYGKAVADRHDMTLQEVLVLLYLNQGFPVIGTEVLAELTGLTRRGVGAALQKLEKRQMIRRETVKRQKLYQLCPEADFVLEELKKTEKELEEAVCAELRLEEREIYGKLSGKLQEGIRKCLKGTGAE
ncbi:MAG: glycosyltransferase [Roseburia sp.]|nr:glycosyltransferase [Roseburia sp.]MCM1096781.1 glycosyltransferase [Ruminococcus flavefaciens]